MKAGHPKTLKPPLPEPLQCAVNLNKQLGAKGLEDFRNKWSEKWEARSKQLEPDESDFNCCMPEHLRDILKPKRLLLWKGMLSDIGHKDMGVFDEVVERTNLLGQVPLTGPHPQTFKPAKASPEEVIKNADATRSAILGAVRAQGDVDAEVRRKSLVEIEAGWLHGPFQPTDLEHDALISRRLGLQQGTGDDTRVGLIDDMSASLVNSAVQVCESPQPHTTDVLGRLLLECLDKFPKEKFLGRSYDLKAAYRQLGLGEEALRHAYITFYDYGDGKPAIHRLNALSFGAIRSAHSFRRVSHSLWELGCSLGLLWTCYFDDFPTVTLGSFAQSTASTVARLFDLLGWRYADEGSRPHAPAQHCRA